MGVFHEVDLCPKNKTMQRKSITNGPEWNIWHLETCESVILNGVNKQKWEQGSIEELKIGKKTMDSGVIKGRKIGPNQSVWTYMDYTTSFFQSNFWKGASTGVLAIWLV